MRSEQEEWACKSLHVGNVIAGILGKLKSQLIVHCHYGSQMCTGHVFTLLHLPMSHGCSVATTVQHRSYDVVTTELLSLFW